jgi:beta-1,2-xylosyltransferase
MTEGGNIDKPQYMNNHGMLLEEHDANMHPKPHTKLFPLFVPSKTTLNGDIPVTPIGRDGRRDDVGPDPEWSKKSGKLYWVSPCAHLPCRVARGEERGHV